MICNSTSSQRVVRMMACTALIALASATGAWAQGNAGEHAAEDSEHALLAQCAARDLQIVLLFEEASVANPRHPALATAALDLMTARRACLDDRRPNGLANYDALIGTLTTVASGARP